MQNYPNTAEHTTNGGMPCPACGKKDAVVVEHIDLASQYELYAPGSPAIQKALLDKGKLGFSSYTVLRCRACGLEYTDPLKAPASEWYEYAYNELEFHASSRWEFDYVANTLAVSDSVGEIGCGTGIFLQKCKNKRVDARGLDFSSRSIDLCLAKGLSASTMHVTEGSSLHGDLCEGKRSVLASFHVLEHLENPHHLFSLASEWATDNAVLWIAVPSDTRSDRLFNKKDFLDDPPHHLTRWTPRALERVGMHTQWHLKSIVKEPLTMRQKLWSIWAYDTDRGKNVRLLGLPDNLARRVHRYLAYPPIILTRRQALDKLSGFSMLACFHRSNQVA